MLYGSHKRNGEVNSPAEANSSTDSQPKVEASVEEDAGSNDELHDVEADISDLIKDGDTVELSFDLGVRRLFLLS